MIHTVERRLLKLRGACPLQESFVRVCTILAAACAQAVPRAGQSKDIRFAELTGACRMQCKAVTMATFKEIEVVCRSRRAPDYNDMIDPGVHKADASPDCPRTARSLRAAGGSWPL